jgi:NADH dehydrogenase FAD-containing subunit
MSAAVGRNGKRRAAASRPVRPRIAIVGANFGGMAAAQNLDGGFDVTVIDRSPWFEWLPNIHELLSGTKRPADLRLPRVRLLRRAGHRFVRGEVARIDAAAGQVETTRGRHLPFDACIVAVGSVGTTGGVRGVERYAMPFKSVDDCAAIGSRLATVLHGSKSRNVVIVGGGLEGLEALGEILRRYRHDPSLRVHVVEGGPRLLPEAPASIDSAVRAHCADFAVQFHTGARVVAVTAKRVRLDDGSTLRSDLTIWTGGVAPPPLLLDSDLADRPRHWAPVTDALQSRRHRNVFVVGNAAGLPSPLDKQAFYALQMGEHAAMNVRRYLAGRRLRAFKPAWKPMLVAFGDLDTFLVAGRRVIASPTLAAAKEGVMQLTMARLDPPFGGAQLVDLFGRIGGAVDGLVLPTLGITSGRSGRSKAALLDYSAPRSRRRQTGGSRR